ncbi:hypothetical protein XELAEV_18018049mg [Xenopus laevis]|uniref:Uncharacterized protein n=1 Tax=Xenopus laevis TaxID=8355 RepID=A0A974DCT9_XENLA|nr:hypothetical protein XELAEV_18018049mg [Xenopus laevis]
MQYFVWKGDVVYREAWVGKSVLHVCTLISENTNFFGIQCYVILEKECLYIAAVYEEQGIHSGLMRFASSSKICPQNSLYHPNNICQRFKNIAATVCVYWKASNSFYSIMV